MFKFKLRTLLVIVTLAAIGFGILAYRMRLAQLREEAGQAIVENGGKVVRNKNKFIERVQLAGETFDDNKLDVLTLHIKYLPYLKELDLVRTPITDDSIESIGRIKQAEEIYLFETKISAEGIKKIQDRLPNVSVKTEEPDPIASSMVAATVYPHAIIAVNKTPDHSCIVTGSGNGKIHIWKSGEASAVTSWQAHKNWTFDVEYSQDGKWIVSGGGDNLVKLWDAKSNELVFEFTESADDIHDVGFSPDGKTLFAASDDKHIRIWDTTSKQLLHDLTGHDRQIPRLAMDHSGTLLASASRDQTVRIWNLELGKTKYVLNDHQADVMSVAFDESGKLLASGDEDGKLILWNAVTGSLVKDIQTQVGSVYDIAFNEALEHLVCCGTEGIQWWDLKTGTTQTSRAQQFVSRISYSAFDGQLVTTNIAGEIHVFDPLTMSLEFVFRSSYGSRGL